MTEQLVDLRAMLSALRRRRLTLASLLGIGLVLAVVYTIMQPTSFVARSGVLLPPSPVDERGKALRDMGTEVQIASSAEVLTRAGKSVTPPVTATALRRKLKVRPVSSAVLEVQVTAPSGRTAARLADAVASEYVAYSFTATSDQSETTMRLLQDQAAKLDEQVRKLDEDIASNTARLTGVPPGSPDALRITALIDATRSQQVEVARELASVNGRIADAQLSAELSRRGTRVLDSAVRPSRPARPRALLNLGVGGLLGLTVGVIVALAREQRDRRLRSRDDIAAAAEAPVLCSLTVPKRNTVETCRGLLEKWEPTTVERLALAESFSHLRIAEPHAPVHLVVIGLPDDPAGLLLPLKLAAFAATTGTATALIVGTQDPAVAALRLACSRPTGEAPTRKNLRVYPGPTDVEMDDLDGTALLVTVLLRQDALLDIPTWGWPTLVTAAISSGVATEETLASVALACLDAGYPLMGVLVANPDPGDRTTGRMIRPLSVNDGRLWQPSGTHPWRPIRSATEGENPTVAAPAQQPLHEHEHAPSPANTATTAATNRLLDHWSDADVLEGGFSKANVHILRECPTEDELVVADLDETAVLPAIELFELPPEQWRKPSMDPAAEAEERFRQAAILEHGALAGISPLLSPDEIVRIAAAPIEEWMVILPPDQRSVATRRYDGPARVRGSAGTGKTVVALHRELAERFELEDSDGLPILFTTFTRSLPPVLEQRYHRLPKALPGRITILNVDQLANQVCRAAGDTPVLDTNAVNAAFASACSRVLKPDSGLAKAGFTQQYLRDEINAVVKGRGVRAVEEYLGMERTGRATRLTESLRRQVWELRREWDRQMTDRGAMDFPDMVIRARDHARRRSRATYRAAIVDEAQDLSLVSLQLIRALVNGPEAKDRPDGLLLVGDGAQRLSSHDRAFPLRASGTRWRRP